MADLFGDDIDAPAPRRAGSSVGLTSRDASHEGLQQRAQLAHSADHDGPTSGRDPSALSGLDAPLAERLRPRHIDEVIGQRDLLGAGKPLRVAFDSGTT